MFFFFFSFFFYFHKKLIVLIFYECFMLYLLYFSFKYTNLSTFPYFFFNFFLIMMVLDSIFGLTLFITSSRNSTFFSKNFYYI